MRYIADSNGYIKEISFGALIECGKDKCVEYTGEVPSGYDSLDAWFMAECESLHKWKIVEGNLVCDSEVADPEEEWTNPPMLVGVEYRTAERWNGKPVYRKLVVYEAGGYIGDTSTYTVVEVPHEISGFVHPVRCIATVGGWGLLPYVADGGGVTAVVIVDETNIELKIVKDRWNSPTIYFDLAYTKE